MVTFLSRVGIMFDKLSLRVTDMLIENGTVTEAQRNLYSYSIGGAIQMALNVLLTMLMGLALSSFAESIIFMAVFLPLRTLCGGYHSESNVKCFFLSLLIVFLVLESGVLVNFLTPLTVHCVFAVSVIVICVLSPVDSKNKRLDRQKKDRMKRLSAGYILTVTAAYCILYVLGVKAPCVTITATLLLISILLVLGILSDRIYRSGTVNDRLNRF
jgi:accessory gene regulator B